MNKVYAVYGASGCGRSLMPIARQCIATGKRIYFIDDALSSERQVNGNKAVNYDMFKTIESDEKYVLVAIANSKVRQNLAEKITKDGIKLWTVQSHSTVIMDEVMIGAGAALSPFVTIGANAKIGKCFHANLYSYVEHDCVIGDFVTFAPRVSCNGNVHIHDHAYIGTGAVIRHGTPDKPLIIGKGAVVGMGAVVTKDVPAGVTVVGNPAKVLVK